MTKYAISDMSGKCKLSRILEEFGPAYVKLGQILACCSDVLPQSYCDELSRLRTDIKPLAFGDVLKVLENEYGNELDKIFASVSYTPVGSASLAQVHKATLFDGSLVAVKILRPGVRNQMFRNLKFLRKLACAGKLIPMSKVANPEMIIDELKDAAELEFNMHSEMENLKYFRSLNQTGGISCPRVYEELCTENVLIMEYVDGIPISEKAMLENNGYDCAKLAERLYMNYAKQILSDGVFHADPHPGNILVSSEKIYWIDLGLLGKVSQKNRNYFKDGLKAFIHMDSEALAQVLLNMGGSGEDVNVSGLASDIEKMLNICKQEKLEQLELKKLFGDFMSAAKKHGVIMPHEVSLLTRSMLPLTDTIRKLDLAINPFNILSDVVSEYLT